MEAEGLSSSSSVRGWVGRIHEKPEKLGFGKRHQSQGAKPAVVGFLFFEIVLRKRT